MINIARHFYRKLCENGLCFGWSGELSVIQKKTENLWKLSAKQKTLKIAENSIFATEKQKISKKIIVFRIY